MVPERKRSGNFMKDRWIHGVRNCGVQLKDRKISTDFMLMFGLIEIIDCWLWQALFIGMVKC